MKKDLKGVRINEEEWYEEARRSRTGWRAMCRLGMEEMAETRQLNRQAAAMRDVECKVCGRKFRRESDKKRHKCVEERRKPVHESTERSSSV